MSAECYDCGRPYGDDGWIEAVIPDKVWNRIKPDGCSDGAGLLCINCISDRLSAAGISDVPVWLCGMEPLKAMHGDPGSYLDMLRNWDAVYNEN
jgi:hypothetical protein